jgi:hypothetical protein
LQAQSQKINTELSYFISIANATEVIAHERLLKNRFSYVRKQEGNSEEMAFRVYALRYNENQKTALIFLFKYDTQGNVKIHINDDIDGANGIKSRFNPYKISSEFDSNDNLKIHYLYKGQKVNLTQFSDHSIIDIFPK